MNKYITLILLIVSCISCGMYKADDATVEYIHRFEQEAKTRGRNIKVNNIVVEIQDELNYFKGGVAVGECASGGVTPKVTILRSFWNRSGDSHKELVIFHELGHCVLNKGHTKEPGIMAGAIVEDFIYNAKRTEYLDAFFKD